MGEEFFRFRKNTVRKKFLTFCPNEFLGVGLGMFSLEAARVAVVIEWAPSGGRAVLVSGWGGSSVLCDKVMGAGVV